MRISLLAVASCALLALGAATTAAAAVPALSQQQALRIARGAVDGVLGARLPNGAGACERISRTRQRCAFAWRQDGRRRSATVRVVRSGPAHSPVDTWRAAVSSDDALGRGTLELRGRIAIAVRRARLGQPLRLLGAHSEDVEITPATAPVDPFTPAPPSAGEPQVLAPAGQRYVTLGVELRNVGHLPAGLVEPRLVTTAGTVVATAPVPGCAPPPQVQPRHWHSGCLAFLVPAGEAIARVEIGRTPETGAWRW